MISLKGSIGKRQSYFNSWVIFRKVHRTEDKQRKHLFGGFAKGRLLKAFGGCSWTQKNGSWTPKTGTRVQELFLRPPKPERGYKNWCSSDPQRRNEGTKTERRHKKPERGHIRKTLPCVSSLKFICQKCFTRFFRKGRTGIHGFLPTICGFLLSSSGATRHAASCDSAQSSAKSARPECCHVCASMNKQQSAQIGEKQIILG